jgi:hypothetical protein
MIDFLVVAVVPVITFARFVIVADQSDIISAIEEAVFERVP